MVYPASKGMMIKTLMLLLLNFWQSLALEGVELPVSPFMETPRPNSNKDVLVDNSNSDCMEGFGGENCNIPLRGCENLLCFNGGICVPWLVGETDHRANCICQPGYDGKQCEISTTFSFNNPYLPEKHGISTRNQSYISVRSDRVEGYELSLSFRTILENGLIAIGSGNAFFKLELKNGHLNIYSSLLNQFEGIYLGDNLNDKNWQKVYVAVNRSHLTFGLNDRLQAIHPIRPANLNETTFKHTFLGGVHNSPAFLIAKDSPPFIGCFQDIRVNYRKITQDDIIDDNNNVRVNLLEKGCTRTEQCDPNPCGNQGTCKDVWGDYQCACKRPFLGKSCQYDYSAITFGYENITDSLAVVDISNPAPFKHGIDLSMFIRTRQLTGQIFYLGSEIDNPTPHKIIGELKNGRLQVEATFGEVKEHLTFFAPLSDGYRHFIRVIRANNLMTIKLNESISINQEIASPLPFQAMKLYLGNVPQNVIPGLSAVDPATALNEDQSHSFFKGVIQDVQLSNGQDESKVVQFFDMAFSEEVNMPESLGLVQLLGGAKKGVVSDDTCRIDPCKNGGICHVIWNDYRCECNQGYKGRNCEEIKFLQ